jgi:hypothetical protein
MHNSIFVRLQQESMLYDFYSELLFKLSIYYKISDEFFSAQL